MADHDPDPIAEAVRRAREFYTQHPEEAVSSDSAARAVLGEHLRVRVEGPHGWVLETGMATGVGGDGSAPSPGWVLRAALASCDAVLVAMQCAEEGVPLSELETEVAGESDDRGLLGMGDVPAGPLRMRTQIRAVLAGDGLPGAEFAALVERALRRSPVADAVRRAVPVEVTVSARRPGDG